MGALSPAGTRFAQHTTPACLHAQPNQTPGMDCSVVESSIPGIFLCSTTDFFYPLVEDPYLQGRIGACNVLSDLYAMGVADIDTVLMILASSLDMTASERDIVTTRIIQGFNDTCAEAGTNVTGGQTVLNPWPIIGGTASSLRKEDQIIRPQGAVPGDVLVLTKPLGTQVAVNLQEWSRLPEKWARVEAVVTPAQAAAAFAKACESMARLNKAAATLMHTHGAHAATDVTGFGILGHATNLAEAQRARVKLQLHTLPIIQGMAAVDAALRGGDYFKLCKGFSAETSGGLLMAVPASAAEALVADLRAADGQPAWIVGAVEALSEEEAPHAYLSEDVRVLEV